MTLRRSRDDLAWLAGLLWDGDDAVLLARGQPPPPGFVPAERYAVAPHASQPRQLVPLATARAAATALDAYVRLRSPGRRLAKRSLALAARLRFLPLLLPNRATVWIRPDLTPERHIAASLPRRLADAAGMSETVVAITLGTPGPNRKPLVQVLDGHGVVRGFAKLGWNPVTRRQVAAEADALVTLQQHPPRHFSAPRLVARDTWRGLEFAVASPLPIGVRRHPDPHSPPPLAVTREIADPLHEQALATSSYWRILQDRVYSSSALGASTRQALDALTARVVRDHGRRKLLFGAWHGDWAPWNVGWSGGKLQVWDWEHWSQDVPFGFDLLHWHFQVAFVVEQRPLAGALACSRQRSGPFLGSLGIPTEDHRLLWDLYLLELTLRFEAAAQAGAGTNPRFVPAVADVLAERV